MSDAAIRLSHSPPFCLSCPPQDSQAAACFLALPLSLDITDGVFFIELFFLSLALLLISSRAQEMRVVDSAKTTHPGERDVQHKHTAQQTPGRALFTVDT